MTGTPRAVVSFDLDGASPRLLTDMGILPTPSDAADPVLVEAVPRIVELCERANCRATLFVVGRTLEGLDREVFDGIDRHELGNHTHTHPDRFGTLPPARMREEVHKAHEAIRDRLGSEPVGFRAPDYSYSPRSLAVLAEQGYIYDSSLLRCVLPPYMSREGIHRGGAPFVQGGIVELPILSSGFPWLPVNGTTMLAFGLEWYKNQLVRRADDGAPLVVNFHARDLIEGVSQHIIQQRFRVRPRETSVSAVEEAVAHLAATYEIVTLRELADELALHKTDA